MRINHLRVENFRCFKENQWKFAPQFNLLIGDNGTGKTAVLKALKVGLGAFLAGFSNYRFEPIDVDDIRLIPNGTTENPTLERTEFVSVQINGIVDGKEYSWLRQIRKGDGVRNSGRTQTIRRVAERLEQSITSDTPSVLPLIAFYPAYRLWKNGLSTGAHIYLKVVPGKGVMEREPSDYEDILEGELGKLGSRLQGYRTALNAQANEGQLRRWLARLELSVLQRGEPNATLDAVKQAVVGSLYECDAFYYDVLLKETVVKNKKGEIFPTRLLSDGQRNVISMVADIAFRCATLNPELRHEAATQTPGVVLIDEIDLHLHPGWQRKIVGNLRQAFPLMQFIATTHSPLVIQSLEAGELIDLGPKIDNEPEKYIGKSPEDIYENVMDVPMPQRSEASLRRYETAMEYYRLLRSANGADKQHIDAVKRRLDELMIPYDKNEAYAAYVSFLKEERIASGIDRRETH